MYDTISLTRNELQSVIEVLQNWQALDSSHIDRKLVSLDTKNALAMLQAALHPKPPSVMQPSDYMLQDVDGQELTVCAHFSGMGLRWPTIITHNNGKRYKFAGNNPMRPWMAGEFSGCASYMEVHGE
jgi:hypothetical protein